MRFTKYLAQFALLACQAFSEQEMAPTGEEPEGIIQFTKQEDPINYLEQHKFAVVSFFNNSAEAKEVDALMEGAKRILDEKVKSGDWTERDVGWYRLNFEENPELDENGDGQPDQLVISNEHNLSRQIHFSKQADATNEAEEARLAAIIRELTGDWYAEIPCEKI